MIKLYILEYVNMIIREDHKLVHKILDNIVEREEATRKLKFS